ncbi:protoporphyrinogen oxidase [Alicyclobacillus mengziensis]|uniref:Coproporphyrinogen III oxidase n=1 Tax=Alicyclobacillus mengziensis TaxID=2931921 RepID=A0A9X7Z5Y8_9BACL|nr:protoporphyrinogen oxidase [Alicyclobacillus mengziensis]QSO45678.1 protoporphyrinogen oxidase [Alicyclobacillus mengziensis]
MIQLTARHVVIIGGGIAGLTAGYRLMQHHAAGGEDLICTVVERDCRFGGKIHTDRGEDFLLELGPDSIYTRKQGGVELISELGLDNDVVPVQSGGGTLIWNKGQLVPLPSGFGMGVPADLSAFAKTNLLTTEAKRRALEDLFMPVTPSTGDVSLGQFLRERLGDELVDMISSPLLAGIHAGDIDRMSLDATMPTLRRIYEEHGSLILGALAMIKNMPQPTGSPKPMFINLKYGLEQLVDRLVQLIENFATLLLETTVTRLERTDGGRYRVSLVGKDGNETYLTADAILLMTPANVSAELLQPCGIDTSALRSIRYTSTATISFGYEGDVGVTKLNSSGYLVPRTQGTPVTACTVVSKKWSHASKTGKTLLRCYVGHDGAEAIVDEDDETLVATIRQHLKDTLGITAEPNFIKIQRWYQAMPQYDVGHLEKVREIEASLEGVPGVAVAGAAYYGSGIPDCVRSASRAVENIEAYLKHYSVASKS